MSDKMIPFKNINPGTLAGIRYIMCDIDDTITSDGKLTAEAYSALWQLKEKGYYVIPVTGRPAGWCDLIVRQWPVDAVIGENGAFVFYMQDSQRKTFTHPSVADGEIQARLKGVEKACLDGVPGCRIAKDQFARIYDLAIDFCEDPPHLGLDAAEKIRDICHSMGAVAKVSSIHVNAWFGDYDKLSMSLMFLKERYGETDAKNKVIFFGDSPNDEPMFSYFNSSCAVANIKPFIAQLKNLPTYVTENEGGAGFAEAVQVIIDKGVKQR